MIALACCYCPHLLSMTTLLMRASHAYILTLRMYESESEHFIGITGLVWSI